MDKIEEEDIASGMQIVSQDMVNEIGLEIRDVFPEAEDSIYMLIGINRSISEEELGTILYDNGVERKESTKLVDLFLWYGVLGVDLPREEPLYIYTVNYNMKMLRGVAKAKSGGLVRYMVNPAFQAALGIV